MSGSGRSGVTPSHRRQGIATGLVHELARRAKDRGFRVTFCETQAANAPAIALYQRVGFHLEDLDLSFYTNADMRRGEVAIFMKKCIQAQKKTRDRRRRDSRRTSK